MTISIIIPVFNVAQYIEECLNSIINQDQTHGLEVILINDCCQDDSIEIANRIISNYYGGIQFSIIHHNRNLGVSSARNTGILKSSGEYIMFLDSDDVLPNTCLSSLSKPLTTKKYDVVIGNFSHYGNENLLVDNNLFNGEINGHKNIIYSKRKCNWYPMAYGKLYNREFIIKHNLFFCENVRIHEDELFSDEVACLSSSIYALKHQSTYYYRIRPDSLMTSLTISRSVQAYLSIVANFMSFIQQHHLEKDIHTNEMLQSLFAMACAKSMDISKNEYNHNYITLRKMFPLLNFKYFCLNNRIRGFIRDCHFIFPAPVGKNLYRILMHP